MKKLASLLVSGSLLISLAPTGLAEETGTGSTKNPDSAAPITNKVTGPCANLKGFEQGRCLRTELRERMLQKRMGRQTLRALRSVKKQGDAGAQFKMIPKKEQQGEKIRKGYWTLKRDIVVKLRESRRTMRRNIWESVQERMKKLKEQESEEVSEEVLEEEPTVGTGEATERLQSTTKATVKIYYNIRGRGQSRRRRRLQLLQQSIKEEEGRAQEEEVEDEEEEEEEEEEDGENEAGE